MGNNSGSLQHSGGSQQQIRNNREWKEGFSDFSIYPDKYAVYSPAIVVQRRDSTRCDKQQKPGFHAAQNQERMDQEQQKLQKHIARAVKQMSIDERRNSSKKQHFPDFCLFPDR